MKISKFRLFVLITEFIYLFSEIFTLIYTIWITKAIKISFIIFFCFNIIYYIFAFLALVKIYVSEFAHLSLLLFYINFFTYFIILTVNIDQFFKYWKYCPYLIKDLDYNLDFERRCELYNINKNSRYSYQYICSYDSSKDFKKYDLEYEIQNDNIICISVYKIKKTNEIIFKFNNEYKDNINYYCSRTNSPYNYPFVNHTNCKKVKYSLMIALYIIFIFEFIFYFFLMCIIIIKLSIKSCAINHGGRRERREQNIIIRDINRLRNSPQNSIERNVENDNIQNRNNELNRIREMRNGFDRIMDLLRPIINNNNQPNNETKESEKSYGVNNFIQQKTRNIIIENKKEYSIETNIKNIISNKENKVSNSINLEEINIQISNTEKNEIINNNNSL